MATEPSERLKERAEYFTSPSPSKRKKRGAGEIQKALSGIRGSSSGLQPMGQMPHSQAPDASALAMLALKLFG